MIYAYGYSYPTRRIGAAYSPLDEASVEFYFSYADATPSSWVDKTVSRTIIQGTGSKQPVVSALSVDYDATDDLQCEAVANVYSGNTSGIIAFAGYFITGQVNYVMTSSDEASTFRYLNIEIDATGKIAIRSNNGTTPDSSIRSTTAIANGAYFYGYMKSDGSTWTMWLNGSAETVTTVGTNSGFMFGDIEDRDNFCIGGWKRVAELPGNTKVNKLAFFSDHTMDTTNLEAFLADPNNN